MSAGSTPSNPSSARLSASTNTSITRTGLVSSTQQSLRPIRRPPGSRTRSVRARFSDHAGLAKCSRWRAWTYCLPLHRQCRHPGSVFYRGSMAGLHVPLPTLRRHPRGCLRTAWGRCGCRVEVLVTQHLPHRSHRAAFPQWALVEGQTRSKVKSLAAHIPPIRRLAASVTRRARL